MNELLYSQVLITCTTINLISIVAMFGMLIVEKLHERRKKKRWNVKKRLQR